MKTLLKLIFVFFILEVGARNKPILGDSIIKTFVLYESKTSLNILQITNDGKYFQFQRNPKKIYLDSGNYSIKRKKIIFHSSSKKTISQTVGDKVLFIGKNGLYRKLIDLRCDRNIFAAVSYKKEHKINPVYEQSTFLVLNGKKEVKTINAYSYIKDFVIEFCQKYSKGLDDMIAKSYSGPEEYISYVGGKLVPKFKDTSRNEILEKIVTIVHETTHSYNTSNRLFINPQVTAELKYLNIFPTCEINKIVSKETQKKIFRFETYLSIDNPVSANKSGILGLLDEYSAYQTGTTFGLQAAEKLFFEGKIDEAEILYQKACASYFANYEFSLFIAWYLEYAKQYKPEIYKETMANKSVRLAFTLNEKMFENTILRIKDFSLKNEKFAFNFKYYEENYASYPKTLLDKHRKTIDGFRIQGVDLENYSAYQNKK